MLPDLKTSCSGVDLGISLVPHMDDSGISDVIENITDVTLKGLETSYYRVVASE